MKDEKTRITLRLSRLVKDNIKSKLASVNIPKSSYFNILIRREYDEMEDEFKVEYELFKKNYLLKKEVNTNKSQYSLVLTQENKIFLEYLADKRGCSLTKMAEKFVEDVIMTE